MENNPATPQVVKIPKTNYFYTNKQKKLTILEQLVSGVSNRALAKQYKVTEKSIRNWKNNMDVSL